VHFLWHLLGSGVGWQKRENLPLCGRACIRNIFTVLTVGLLATVVRENFILRDASGPVLFGHHLFLFILLIILLAFAITVFVINKNSFEHHEFNEQEYEDLNTERFKNQYSFLDAFYVQWLLGLGEFEMLGLIDDSELLEQPAKILMWILFLSATFFSQVIMFNTLIAILGDTFSRIMEKRVHYAMKAKTEMYADYMYWVKMRGLRFTEFKYIYVVRPIEDEEEQEWEGIVTVMRRRIENLRVQLTKDISKNQDMIKNSKNEI